jgi:NMD protein affecting ribosome stability and mRNA decay
MKTETCPICGTDTDMLVVFCANERHKMNGSIERENISVCRNCRDTTETCVYNEADE